MVNLIIRISDVLISIFALIIFFPIMFIVSTLIIVIDGRQVNSRGVYLEELAIIMKNLGCVDALNLDGGGSSVLLVKEELMNRPYGSNSMREIMSAISIHQTSKL